MIISVFIFAKIWIIFHKILSSDDYFFIIQRIFFCLRIELISQGVAFGIFVVMKKQFAD